MKKNIGSILFFSIFVLVHLSYLKDSTSQEKAVTESLLMFSIVVWLVLLIASSINTFSVASFEIIAVSFILYLVIRSTLLYTLDVTLIGYLFFLVFLFFGLKFFFSVTIDSAAFILSFATVLTFLSYIAFTVYYIYNNGETASNLFLKNKSIFSILLASQIAMVIPLCLYFKTNKKFIGLTTLIVCSVVASVVILGLSDGRSGWLGFTIALIFIFYHSMSIKRFKKPILYSILPSLIVLLTILFWYKPGSSKGRLLIYKVSASMLKENWFFGIGSGKFKGQYNLFQAAYFEKLNINSKEAMFADNTFYAFNDFYQIIVETGLVGLLFLFISFILLIRQVKKTEVESANRHVFLAAIASLISIFVGSLFSFPLQIFPIAFQATICLSVISSFGTPSIWRVYFSNKATRILRNVFLVIGCFLGCLFFYQLQFSKTSLEAFELQRTGFRKRAIEEYEQLHGSIIKDGNVLYQYAQELFNSNQTAFAADILHAAKKYYCSNNAYKLSAQIEQELHHFVQAEKDYRTAVYMVPNRMISRYDLLEYYMERKDTANIIYWCNSIIEMPVKVPSQITTNIQKKVKTTLLSIGR